MAGNWRIEQLDASHDRARFCSGKAQLDDFLHKLAGQYEKRDIGRTYVAVLPGDNRVFGYYTISAGAITSDVLPPKYAKKLPKHLVPVAHLGRLAVDQAAQGHGLGEMLLMHALRGCVDLSRKLGIFAVIVHTLDADAKPFYLKYGFLPLEDDASHLFLPMKDLRASIK